MGLIPIPPRRIDGGKVLYRGRDILRMPPAELRALRGKSLSMIFQDSMTSLNPVFSVGDQLVEVICLHQRIPKRQARERAIEMLNLVGISSPAHRIDDYPFQMSGGMRQRAMIAIALACRPRILIADEPTTALDVTIQAQILKLIAQLQGEIGMSVMLITHNLGIVASLARRVAVMYAGRIVEEGPVETIFNAHHHPYSRGLLRSVPRLDLPQGDLQEIRGTVPRLNDLPEGCTFSNRCDLAAAAVVPGRRCL